MIHFIINPTAGSDKGISVWRDLEPELIKYSLSYDVFFTQYPTQATEEATRLLACEEAPVFAILGGDGTLHEVLEALKDESSAKATLMYLPCGSGNDFARGLALTKDPMKFAADLAAYSSSTKKGETPAHMLALSHGFITIQDEKENFFVSGGIGFDASVTEAIATSPLKPLANRLKLGTLAYLLLGIRQVFTEKSAPARIIVDGKKQLNTDRLFFLSAHNLKYEGGGFPFAPHANPEADEIALCIFYDMGILGCIVGLLASLFGLHKYKKGVALLTCKHVEIFSEKCRTVHTDGESLGYLDHISFSAGKGRIRLLYTKKADK